MRHLLRSVGVLIFVFTVGLTFGAPKAQAVWMNPCESARTEQLYLCNTYSWEGTRPDANTEENCIAAASQVYSSCVATNHQCSYVPGNSDITVCESLANECAVCGKQSKANRTMNCLASRFTTTNPVYGASCPDPAQSANQSNTTGSSDPETAPTGTSTGGAPQDTSSSGTGASANARGGAVAVANTPTATTSRGITVADTGLLVTGEAVFGRLTGDQQDIGTFIGARIINPLFALLGIAFFLLIIFAGFKWMTAGGNEDAVKQARGMIVNATIGLVVILSAYAITRFILLALTSA